MTHTHDQTAPSGEPEGTSDTNDCLSQIDDLCRQLQAVRAALAERDLADNAADAERAGFQHAQLTGTLAHELRSPLSSINTAFFVIKRKAAAADLDITEACKRIENSLSRCNDVITTLLDKSWTNQMQTVELPFDEWLAKQVRSFASRAPQAVDVQCDLTVGDLQVHFDPVRLENAIGNILSNAVETLVGDGINAPHELTDNPTISIQSKKTDRGVEVTLTNNGPCIPEGKIEDIMQPWVTTKAFGSGLGLPLVKCILEQHGGGLDIENLAPQGVTFTLWISDKETSSQAA
jgi:signal transduction histidine kinase